MAPVSAISRLRKYPLATQSLIALTLAIAFILNLYGLLTGVSIVLPHLFYIPLILAAFFYPRRGIPFAIALSVVYLAMVLALRPDNSADIVSAAARSLVYIFIAVVVSYLSEQVMTREQEVTRAKEEWEYTFNAIPDLIALIGREHKILRVNKAMADRLGVIPEQAVGMRCYEVVHHSATHPGNCPHALLLKDGKEHTAEVHEDHLGGDYLVTTSPLYDASGTLIGSVHSARDITERKRAEEALREKTLELEQYFSTSLDLFCIADTQGYFRRLNPQWEKTLGYPLGELEGKRFLDFVHPDDLPATLDAMKDLSSQREVINFTNRYRHKNGTYRWIEWRSFPNRDLIFAAARDVTDRKHIEEALRESESHYRTIIDNLQDVYFRTDTHGQILMVSPSAAPMFGYATADEIVGLSILTFWKNPDARTRMIQHMQEHRGEVKGWEAEFLKKDGTTFWVSINGRLLTDDEGKVLGTEGIWRDVSESKKFEEALKTALKKLNTLSSITRHDILNQITGLRTFLELSRQDLKGTCHEEFLNKGDQAAEAIQRQIEFTKYYQDIGVNAPLWQNVDAIIREAAAQINFREVTFTISISNMEIFADPLIVKVFFNLMENSLRHGERVTEITFSSRETETGVIIIYSDNGVGISKEDKQKLFRKGFGKHTGLGLFLSREILAITDIGIMENGVPGEGVRFEIVVPKEGYRPIP
jgi:PAS domain S-box-containing protein